MTTTVLNRSPFTLSMVAGIGIGAVGISIYLLGRSKSSTWHQVGTVDTIKLYPIKGLPGFPVGGQDDSSSSPPVEVTPLGLKCGKLRDRCFVLGRFTSSGSFEFVSPRSIPKMWLVKVRPTEDYSAVLVDAPGMDQIKIDFPQPDQSSHVKVEIWRSTAAALLCCDDSVNKWFSTFLEKDNLLLACGLDSTGNLISPRNPHSEDPKFGKYAPQDMQILFSDGAPLLFVSDASHLEVNRRIESQGRKSLNIQCWKANIILKSENQLPFAEDEWSRVKVGSEEKGELGGEKGGGGVVFERLRPCTRCTVTRVDAETGQYRRDEEPLRTLRTFRLTEEFGSDPLFGSLLSPLLCGPISVGMPVYAIKQPVSS